MDNPINKKNYKISETLARFSRRGVESFEGMLNKSAAVTAAAAATVIKEEFSWENRAFLEIGVYKGKFFSLIENATKGTDCKLIGVDPFNLEDQQFDSVYSSFKTHDMELDRIHLYQGFSTDTKEIKNLLGERKLTLAHIDGSHKEEDVYQDFHLLNELASSDGIVIGDDFWNKSQLGVMTAVFRFVLEDKIDLKPFMISNTKIYFCRESYLDFYRDAFIEAFKQNSDFTIFQEWIEKRDNKEPWHTEQKLSRFPVLLV